MATLADVIRKRRSSGQSRTKSLMGSFKEKLFEKIDPRQFLNQSGILTALFPSLKAFKAGGDSTKESSNVMKKTVELIHTNISSNITNLNDISINTEIMAKNSLVLPVISRDMNIMRQNIAKLLKAFGVTPTNKADSYFKKSKEREKEYESKFKRGRGPLKPVVDAVKNVPGMRSILGFLEKIVSPLLAIVKGLVGIISSGLKTLFGMLLTPLMAIITKAFDKVTDLLMKFMTKALKSLLDLFNPAKLGTLLGAFLRKGGGIGIVIAALTTAGYTMNELRIRNQDAFKRSSELQQKIKDGTITDEEKLEYGKLITKYPGTEQTIDQTKNKTDRFDKKQFQHPDKETTELMLFGPNESRDPEEVSRYQDAKYALDRFGVSQEAVKIYYDAYYGKNSNIKARQEVGNLQEIQRRLDQGGMFPPEIMDPMGSTSGFVTKSTTPSIQTEVEKSIPPKPEPVPSPIIEGKINPDGSMSGGNFPEEVQTAKGKVSLDVKNVNVGEALDDGFRNVVAAKTIKSIDEEPVVIESNNSNQQKVGTKIQMADVYDREFLKYFLPIGQ